MCRPESLYSILARGILLEVLQFRQNLCSVFEQTSGLVGYLAIYAALVLRMQRNLTQGPYMRRRVLITPKAGRTSKQGRMNSYDSHASEIVPMTPPGPANRQHPITVQYRQAGLLSRSVRKTHTMSDSRLPRGLARRSIETGLVWYVHSTTIGAEPMVAISRSDPSVRKRPGSAARDIHITTVSVAYYLARTVPV